MDPETGSRLPTTATFRISNIQAVPVNETHVTFKAVDSDLFMDGKWEELSPYMYNDGTSNIPSDLPAIEINYQYIGTPLRATGMSMAGVVVVLSVAFAGWTLNKRNRHVVKASQPIFLLILCLGTLTMGMAIIPLGIDDEIVSETSCDVACMATPWLASLGFVLVFAALFSKTYRVYRIMNQPRYHRVVLSAYDVMSPMILLMLLNVMVLALWTASSPLEWQRDTSNTDLFGRPNESRGYCVSDNYKPFAYTLLSMDLAALALTSYQSYLARGISTEFAESEYIDKVVASMLLVSFVGVPTIFIVSDNPQARFFLMTCVIFVICTAALLFIFVPKLMAAQKGSFDHTGAVRQSQLFVRRRSTATTQPTRMNRLDNILEGSMFLEGEAGEGMAVFNTKDEYRRLNEEHQKLLESTQECKNENEKLLSEIKELKARLGESDTSRTGSTSIEEESGPNLQFDSLNESTITA